MDQEQLPAITGDGEVEIVPTRDYCRMRIRDHARRTVEEALQVGRYVHEARETFDIKKGRPRKGDPNGEAYDLWLAETCEGIMAPSYAEQLRLMYEREESYKKLHDRRDMTIQKLDQVLREEAGATKKKDKKEDDKKEQQKSAGAAGEDELAKAREKADEAERKRQLHYANWQKAVDDRKEAEQKAKDAEREREQERERISQAAKDNAAKQIAEYQARYNIPDIPEIFQSDPESFKKLQRKIKDERTLEALEVLQEAMRLVGKMMRYEPEEAAQRFMEWHDRDRAKEQMERYGKWLTSCMEEIERQTSPGLRVMGGR